jgi:hypothetical protein
MSFFLFLQYQRGDYKQQNSLMRKGITVQQIKSSYDKFINKVLIWPVDFSSHNAKGTQAVNHSVLSVVFAVVPLLSTKHVS